jgi:hypothetical protein
MSIGSLALALSFRKKAVDCARTKTQLPSEATECELA